MWRLFHLLFVCLPVCGLSQSGPRETAVDFVHAESVFDTTYPTFRCIDSLFALRKKVVREYPSPNHDYLYRDGPFSSTFQARVAYLARGYAGDLTSITADMTPSVRDSLRTQLACQMMAFADTAEVLPTVYAQVAVEYGGDVRAYVDALFDGSVMTNRRRMRRLSRHPTAKRMRDDMGFQFAVSKLMFRLWEQQGCPANPVVDGTRLVILRSELDAMKK